MGTLGIRIPRDGHDHKTAELQEQGERGVTFKMQQEKRREREDKTNSVVIVAVETALRTRDENIREAMTVYTISGTPPAP